MKVHQYILNSSEDKKDSSVLRFTAYAIKLSLCRHVQGGSVEHAARYT